MTGTTVTLSQAEKLYCFRDATLDGVAKVIHQQLCDVTETLNNLKAESQATKVSQACPKPEVAAPTVQEPEVSAPTVQEPEVSAPTVPEPEVAAPTVPEPEVITSNAPVEPALKVETIKSLKSDTPSVNTKEPDQTQSKTSKKNKKSKAKKNANKIVEDATVSAPESVRDIAPAKVAEPVSVPDLVKIAEPIPVPEPVKLSQPASVSEQVKAAEPVSVPEPVKQAEPVPLPKTEKALDGVAKTKDAVCSGMQALALSGDKVGDVVGRLTKVEAENTQLKSLLTCLEARLVKLEGGEPAAAVAAAPAPAPAKAAAPAKDDDDDFDMFGDEEDDEEVAKRNAERVAAYQAKKAASNKPALIAKSSILLDCKPWDDETNMKELEEKVRSIAMDGLVWGQSKLVPVAYGLKKLQIGCVIEDDKVSTEILEEKILEFEDHCQSVDIAAFNKI